jgi:hypothetical protein
MNYTESIRSGYRIINRNLQLVFIQVGAMFTGFIGFFIFVGIPLAIAFIIFGLDLTELSRFEDVFRTLREPSEMLSKYFALVLFVLTSLLLYLTMVLALGIFLFGGSIGMISRSLISDAETFTVKAFLSEGKRLFFPLIGFTTLIGLIFIVVAFVLGLFGGAIAAIVSLAREQEATLAMFLGIFFSLVLFVIGLSLILITLSVTIYGTAVMALRGAGPLESLKESIRYLSRHPHAFYLYCMIFGGYIFISFVILFLSYPIGLIPFVGALLAVGYHFFVYIVQSYLGLVMIAAILWYYHSSTKEGPSPEQSPEAVILPASESSTLETGISGPQGPGHGESPPDKGGMG